MKRKLDIGDIYGPCDGSNTAKAYVDPTECTVNPFTNKPYSPRYYEILKKRQQLPVYEFKKDLIEKVRTHQTIVVEGETGSGTCLRGHEYYFDFS
jgi:pre-mRNA-splicing factor ATP-dependent RNA helicase DHX15/PRP43